MSSTGYPTGTAFRVSGVCLFRKYCRPRVDSVGPNLNINADTVACSIGAALSAEKLILASDVDGLLKADKTLISHATPLDIKTMIDDGVISGGMIPKANSAVTALRSGVHSVHIINGKKTSTLLAEVFTDTGSGTMIHHES